MKNVLIFLLFTLTSFNLAAQAIEAETTIADQAAILGINAATTGVGFGIRGETSSTQGRGVYGYHKSNTSTTDIGFGVYGETLAEKGRGVVGYQRSATGLGYGVYGLSDSQTGSVAGVIGEISSTTPGSLSAGVRGVNKGLGTLGIGVYGSHGGAGWGVYGEANNGVGVYGKHLSLNGVDPGVWGASVSTEAGAIAILGELVSGQSGLGSAAVVGRNEGTVNDGSGVYGRHAGDGAGVFGQALGVAGIGVLGQANGFDFYAANASSVNYGGPSSRRWKSNVENISDPLGMIAQLRGVRFDWDEAHGSKHDIGFIAEEVGEIIPEIVVYEENGIDAVGLDYSKMTPLLVEAVRVMREEYQAKFAAMQEEIDRLKRDHDQLKNGKAEMNSNDSEAQE